VAKDAEQFGIRITAVARGFFRTDLFDAQNAKYATSSIEDYAGEGMAEAMWSGYDGKQQGDPAKLGDVLVKITAMGNPPKQFLAGSDAFGAYKPALEGQLEELRAYATRRDRIFATRGFLNPRPVELLGVFAFPG
jgi:NAD(P)-dependent dehydrogenase (short-subunit alcohol dehydrogenase family)